MRPVSAQAACRNASSEPSSRTETRRTSMWVHAAAMGAVDGAGGLVRPRDGDGWPACRSRPARPPSITARRSPGSPPARMQYTIASAERRTPSSARPPPRSAVAPSISPGISTNWTSGPADPLRAGTGRRGERWSPGLIWMSDSAWRIDELADVAARRARSGGALPGTAIDDEQHRRTHRPGLLGERWRRRPLMVGSWSRHWQPLDAS